MKHIIIILSIMIICIGTLQAQNRKGTFQDRLEAQHIAFMTDKLELTPEESKNFWPLYNEYDDKMREVRQSDVLRPFQIKNLSDDEALEVMNKYFKKESEKLDLRKAYFERFKEAIPPRKIVRIVPAEEAFKREILKKLRAQ